MRDNTKKKTFVQVARVIDDKKCTTDLQHEKDKKQLLQKELNRITEVHNKLNKRYKTDVANIRQQAYTFKCDLDNEIKKKNLLQSHFEKLQVEYGL